MNTHTTKLALVSIFTVTLLLTSQAALADDLNPPPYRGAPLSVYGHWNLLPGSVFLNLTGSSWVDDNDPTTTLHPLPFSSPVFPDSTHTYQIQLPNWIDQMPIKYLRLQLAWYNTSQPPLNIFSQALDGPNSIFGQITYTSPIVPDASGAGAYQYIDFEYKPNPDFERIYVQMPSDAVLHQVVIDSVSTVPEPATLLILAMGGLGLLRKKVK